VENTAPCYHALGGSYTLKADYNQSISNYLRAAEIYQKFSKRSYYNSMSVVAVRYGDWGNIERSLYYSEVCKQIAAGLDTTLSGYHNLSLSKIMLTQNKFAEALDYAQKINLAIPNETNIYYAIGLAQKSLIYTQMGKPQEGFTSLMKAVHLGDSLYPKLSNTSGYFELEYALFKYFSATNKLKEAEKFLLKAYAKSVEEKVTDLQIKYLRDIVSFYLDHSQPEKARGYSSAYFKLSDTLNTNQNRYNIAQYEIEQKESEQNKKLSVLQQERAVQEATIKQRNLILWISLGAILLIAASVIFLYRQLVINKKVLQSLGKTQRPLNFVNNFSEVSIELIEEVKSEKLKAESERDSELESELLDDISQNLQKIAHHGKRADGIVKGMLQHSRASSTSNQEPTDINKLADEYLRLAYHGLRAKDKTFNAAMDTDFDETIGNINIIPQDIGRVILNLITNAFYAVDEKKKHIVTDYEPTVSMSTKKVGDKVLIFVKDNGNGIPEKILDKIFQPFFTTKPTGQGTGLGLSMSYDVIKAHGGELKVETKEGEGSSFIVQLPIV
jgi:signal transduction histidine kinase